MEWIQVFIIIASTLFAGILFFIRENRVDFRIFREEIRSWQRDINKEIKDLDRRLQKIEERRK